MNIFLSEKFKLSLLALAFALVVSTLVPINTYSRSCIKMGCTKTYCVKKSMAKKLAFSCEVKPTDVCYKRHGICVELENGECGWYKTEEFTECMSERGGLKLLPEKINKYY